MFRKRKNQKDKQAESEILYTHCLNCGTELNGNFCHNCGQHAIKRLPLIKDFVVEYLSNAFIWDPLCLKTLWKLIRRPGQLTKEYMRGKLLSQENPLKLNMFLLFVFVSMFLIFSGDEKADESVDNLTKDELVYPLLQMDFLKQDVDFTKRMKESSRDTVQLYAPLSLLEKHADVVTKVEVIENTHGERPDKWIAVIPSILIEDKIIVANEDNYYVFNTEDEIVAHEFEIFISFGKKLIDFITNYFPMLMLLTTPFLTFALAFIQRRSKLPLIKHFIFSLHYTAFIELIIILIYAIYLIANPSMDLLQWIMRICASAYLIAAFRRVYEPNSWIKSIYKALLTYLLYLLNCIIILFIIFIVICFIVALRTI
jgi:hypothetical protein